MIAAGIRNIPIVSAGPEPLNGGAPVLDALTVHISLANPASPWKRIKPEFTDVEGDAAS